GGVRAFDLGAEFLLHRVSFDFQGGREEAVFDGPGLVCRYDAPHPDIAREFLQAIVCAPDKGLLVALPSHRHERQERAAFADQDALFEYSIPENGELNILRRKLFAVRQDEHVFQAPAYVDPAVADFGKIAGMEPTLAVQGFRARLGVAPITLHHARA